MHPEWDFYIYNSQVYINNSQNIAGLNTENYKGVPPGFLSLYEYNLDRTLKTRAIFPFVNNNSDYKVRFRRDLKNMTGEPKADSIPFGSLPAGPVSSSYQMSASITRQYLNVSNHTINGPLGPFEITDYNPTSSVLRNMCLQYKTINPHFNNTTLGTNPHIHQTPLEQMFSDDVNMINIPSIFYGSEIKRGTVDLNYLINGTIISSASDSKKNGQLISTSGSTSGSVVGHVLYREGILFFPKSGSANTAFDRGNNVTYDASGSPDDARWIYFGAGANDGITQDPSVGKASFSINFEGTTYKNTMTMFCHADKGQLNYSNNPTFLNNSQHKLIGNFSATKYSYSDSEIEIKNVASSSFHKGEDEFRKVTYISKVGIYDEDNNLLMTVDLARPYKNEEKDHFTFKIKYDLL